MISRRRFLSGALAAALGTTGLASAACGRSSSAAGADPIGCSSSAQPAFTLYSSEEPEYVARLASAFTADTGIGVVTPRLGGPGVIYSALQEERNYQVTGADVVYGGGPFVFSLLHQHRLLDGAGDADTEALESGRVPAGWEAVEQIAFTLAGRGAMVGGLETLWDLPELTVPVIIPDPGRWDYGTMLVLAVLDRFRASDKGIETGWQFWERLKGRLQVAKDPADLRVRLVDGTEGIAILPRHLAAPWQASVPDLWLRWPSEVPTFPNFAARIARATCSREAARFMEWLHTPSARAVLLAAGRLPSGCVPAESVCATALEAASRAIPLDVGWGFSAYNRVRAEWQRRFVL